MPSSYIRFLFLPFPPEFMRKKEMSSCLLPLLSCPISILPPPDPFSSFSLVPDWQFSLSLITIWLLHKPQIHSPYHESSISLFHTLWSTEPTPFTADTNNPCEAPLLHKPARLPFSSLFISGIEAFPFFSCKLSSVFHRSLNILFGFSRNLYTESCKLSQASPLPGTRFSMHLNCVCIHNSMSYIHVKYTCTTYLHIYMCVFKYIGT